MLKDDEKFALTNPISLITGKEREEFTREDLLRVIIEKQIERITFHYTALDGKLKELKIPVSNRKQIELILTEGERVDGSSLFKGIVETGRSDLYVVPVYKSAFLSPFDKGGLNFICRFLNSEGELAWFTGDNILHNACQLLRKNTGYELNALGELEFYLLGNYENKSYSLGKQKGYQATAPFVKSGWLLNEMLRYLTQIYGNVKYAHSEVGYLDNVESEFQELKGKTAEQVEIEFLLTHIEDTADMLVLACWLIRNVAFKYGYIATFFPKIEIGHAGNGMHIHLALMKDGKNVMLAYNGDLSKEAKMLIGGLCRYATSLTAFGNMVPASYLRLVPNQETPTRVCWSDLNRSALIRIPLGWSKVQNLTQKINPQQKEELKVHDSRQTIELRSPDGSSIAHFLLAGITLSAEWGLTRKKESLSLAKNCHLLLDTQNSSSLENYPELPTSCVESAEKLLQVRNLYERENIFPPALISFIAESLQNENDRNLNVQLMSMPEEERILQSRRIMHKDIHKH